MGAFIQVSNRIRY